MPEGGDAIHGPIYRPDKRCAYPAFNSLRLGRLLEAAQQLVTALNR